MKKTIILFIALLIVVQASVYATSCTFYDGFDRSSPEDFVNGYTNGWSSSGGQMINSYWTPYPFYNLDFSGQFLKHNQSDGIDLTNDWTIVSNLALGTNTYPELRYHCVVVRNTNDAIYLCPDVTIYLPSVCNISCMETLVSCTGSCSCTYNISVSNRSMYNDAVPYGLFSYDAGTQTYTVARDDGYTSSAQVSGCNLSQMNLELFGRSWGSHFEDVYMNSGSSTQFCIEAPFQPNATTCNASQGCILYEDFPYNDSIYLNGWADLTGNPLPDLSNFSTGKSLRFNNYDGFLNNVDIYKNFTHSAANFENISFRGQFSAVKNTTFINQNHSLYLRLTNGNQTAVKLGFVMDDYTEILDIYYYFDENTSTLIDSQSLSLLPNKNFTIDFVIDQQTHFVHILNYVFVMFSNVVPDRIEFTSNQLDSVAMNYYSHLISITGQSTTPLCNDGIDNDFDGLTDYPNDPACLTVNGTTEYPQNFYQCNDGVDNDGDGLTDYPADPSCLSQNGTTELPKQGTSQPNDECPVASLCLFRDTFPYNDDLIFHNWTYDRVREIIGVPTPFNCTSINNLSNCGYYPTFTSISTDYAINLAKNDENFSAYHVNFTNSNTYSDNIADFRFMFDGQGYHEESINLTLGNGAANSVRIYLKVDRQNTYTVNGNQYKHRISIYASSAGTYYFLGYAYTKDLEEFELQLVLDNEMHTFIVSYDDSTRNNLYTINATFNYDSLVVPSKLNMFSNLQYNYAYLLGAHIYGAIIQTTPTCNTFSKPKYLYETFDYGKLSDCGWVTNKDITVLGEFNIKNNDGEISAYKHLQANGHSTALTNTMSRYVTVQWDEYIDSQSDDIANTNTIFIQDSQLNTISFIYFDKGTGGLGRMFSSDGGSPELITSLITTDTFHTIKVVIDLTSDTQTLIVDGTTLAQSAGLQLVGFDYDNVASFEVASGGSQYKIDNVMVYTSDAAGGEVVVTPTTQQGGVNGTYWGGLFFTETPSCLADSDCISGQCLPYGTCSSFNWKVCDEAGKARDNYCILSEMTYAAFSWIGDVITDNFYLFIIFLILLMMIVYLVIMFRGKR